MTTNTERCNHGECAWQDDCIYPDRLLPAMVDPQRDPIISTGPDREETVLPLLHGPEAVLDYLDATHADYAVFKDALGDHVLVMTRVKTNGEPTVFDPADCSMVTPLSTERDGWPWMTVGIIDGWSES